LITNTAAGAGPEPPADDILHIKARLDTPGPVRPPLLATGWFLGLQSLPVAAWLVLFWIRKRNENLANNPRLLRQRQVAQRVRDGFEDLRHQAVAGESQAFFATLFRLLQERLGERLDLPASAITEAVVTERLNNRGLPETTLASLHELFHICNQARYAAHGSGQELASLIPKTESVLRQLEEVKS